MSLNLVGWITMGNVGRFYESEEKGKNSKRAHRGVLCSQVHLIV